MLGIAQAPLVNYFGQDTAIFQGDEYETTTEIYFMMPGFQDSGFVMNIGGGRLKFVHKDSLNLGGTPTWGTIEGDPADQTDLMALLNAKAPINNATFTGTTTTGFLFTNSSGSTNSDLAVWAGTAQSNSNSNLQFKGSTNTLSRIWERGDAFPTITNGYAYVGHAIGRQGVTEPSSGSIPLISALGIRAPNVVNGGAEVTNAATVYIEDSTVVSTTGGSFALWVDNGLVKFDGDLNVDGTITNPGLTSALAGKANISHTHEIEDITNLQTTLDGKANTSHDHDGDYATTSHTHAQSDITNLVTDLGNKAPINDASLTGTLKIGGGVTTTILDGNGSTFSPQTILSNTSQAGFAVYANDGTLNGRVGLFMDATNSLGGISMTQGGSSFPFVIRNSGGERLRINANGTLKLNAYGISNGLLVTNGSGDVSSVNLSGTGIRLLTAAADGSLGSITMPSLPYIVRMGSDYQTPSGAAAGSLNTVTDFGFPVLANKTYKFSIYAVYEPDPGSSTTNGAGFSLSGPAANFASALIYQQDVSTITFLDYNMRAFGNTSGLSTGSLSTGNLVFINGTVSCSSSGTVSLSVASELAGPSYIKIKANASWIEYQQLD